MVPGILHVTAVAGLGPPSPIPFFVVRVQIRGIGRGSVIGPGRVADFLSIAVVVKRVALIGPGATHDRSRYWTVKGRRNVPFVKLLRLIVCSSLVLPLPRVVSVTNRNALGKCLSFLFPFCSYQHPQPRTCLKRAGAAASPLLPKLLDPSSFACPPKVGNNVAPEHAHG